MSGVIQSGNVTPGNIVKWVTDDIVQDGGPQIGPSETVLARLLSANFNTTSDQQIAIPSTVNKFNLTRIIVTNASLSLTTAVGGFYSQPGKAGSAIVAAGQAYAALTTAVGLLNPTLTVSANTTAFTPANLTAFSVYFALTTAQGVAAVADIFLVGIILG